MLKRILHCNRYNFCRKVSLTTYDYSNFKEQRQTQFPYQTSAKLNRSPLRLLNIGNNYFRYTNPRRKKILMILLNSYLKQFIGSPVCENEFKKALDLFYNMEYQGKKIECTDNCNIEFDQNLLWHLNVFTRLECVAFQYSRFEFLEYDDIIKKLNAIPKEKRNRAKYVFTSHPTQPNSIEQVECLAEIYKALEENDLDYLDYNMAGLVKANKSRQFKKPTYLEESETYHSICIPNMINAFSSLYDAGLKEPYDFFEAPGTWITFDFDNHPEMSQGIMTFTHGLTLQLTIKAYMKILNEAELNNELKEVFVLFDRVLNYAQTLINLSEQFRFGRIDSEEFLSLIPKENIYDYEKRIIAYITEGSQSSIDKVRAVCKKLVALLKIFRLNACVGQIRFPGEDLQDENKVKKLIFDILKEISILNRNFLAADMLIIANYEYQAQYELVQKLLNKFQVENLEIVPLLETFSSSNDADSKITMIASSDTRQRDGLLLTELRVLREYKKNPNKSIYLGQGIPAERGGGPIKLLGYKYGALTKMQRQRHIRTVQGHYFMSEFSSRDLVFSFVLEGILNINKDADFEPSQDYMDFLFELDNVVGVPQREMQRTKEFNDFYVGNNLIHALVESFNYGGSRELKKPFEFVKKQRAIVQAYINSDRCSLTHPELAFWDRLDDSLISKISKYYYEDNPHFKYILYNYAFMLKRFDLDFARDNLNIDENSQVFKNYKKGKNALAKILNHLGLSENCEPLEEIWNQHLGLVARSSYEEMMQKFQAFRLMYLLQNHHVKKYLKEKTIGIDSSETEKKIKILQSALANISSSNGKG